MLKRAIVLFSLLLLVAGCAKMLTPNGGPKDTMPPEVVKTAPLNNSLHFAEKNIKITFNEYVVLNNANENILFSPPLKNAPAYSLSNKSLLIHFNDTLRPNTTYNIAFTDAVKDFTEGNLLPFYLYTFSTGDAIDTFAYEGRVVTANDCKPAEGVLVFLYQHAADSLPRTTHPDHITKTQKNGTFRFNHIAEGHYKLFALKDINQNYLYDLPNEAVAFADTLVAARPMPQPDTDSTAKKKTPHTDSLALPTLALFTAQDTTQKLLRTQQTLPGLYQISFQSGIRDYQLRSLDTVTFRYFERLNATRDTLFLFAKNIPADTVRLKITYSQHIDTLTLTQFKATKAARGRGKKVPSHKLSVTASHQGEIYQDFALDFSYPIQPADSIPVWVVKKKKSGDDTTLLRLSVPDSFVTHLEIPIEKEGKVPYHLMIPDSVFRAYNGTSHDTLHFDFVMKSEKEYGELVMNYIVPDHRHYLVTLLTAEGREIRSDEVRANVRLTYPHLPTGTYQIKALCDDNGNGRWDTGAYDEKRQPEQILQFPKTLNIRGYWELEETFEIK